MHASSCRARAPATAPAPAPLQIGRLGGHSYRFAAAGRSPRPAVRGGGADALTRLRGGPSGGTGWRQLRLRGGGAVQPAGRRGSDTAPASSLRLDGWEVIAADSPLRAARSDLQYGATARTRLRVGPQATGAAARRRQRGCGAGRGTVASGPPAAAPTPQQPAGRRRGRCGGADLPARRHRRCRAAAARYGGPWPHSCLAVLCRCSGPSTSRPCRAAVSAGLLIRGIKILSEVLFLATSLCQLRHLSAI